MTSKPSGDEPSLAVAEPFNMSDKACWWLSTAFGLGASPLAPGTFGTVFAILPTYLVFSLSTWSRLWALLGLALLTSAIAVPLGAWAEKYAKRKDPGWFVLDEVAGYFVAMAFCVGFQNAPAIMILAFVFHRVFDITKPPPARSLERLPHGWGMLCDDLASSVYAGLATLLSAWLLGIG